MTEKIATQAAPVPSDHIMGVYSRTPLAFERGEGARLFTTDGEAYLDKNELGDNPVQSARWFSLAAKKGHVGAQAKLGNILFNGDVGLKANRIEGLMWLTVAGRTSAGTIDADWISDLLNGDMSVATPEERKQAIDMADRLEAQLAGL